MRAVLTFIGALSVLGVVLSEPTLPQCCKDLDGNDLSPGGGGTCTCLTDDTTLTDLTVPEGQYAYFHWVMTDWSIINVPDEDRPEMTIEVAPCTGDAHLYVQGPSLQADPFPSVESSLWNASASYQPNAITFSLTAAQYFVSVFGNLDSPFSIAAQISGNQITGSKFPTPGGNGTVVALAQQTEELLLEGDPIGMDITFYTADAVHGDENTYEYRLYQLEVVEGMRCGEANITEAFDCILSSFCGVEDAMTPASDWQSFSPGENVTIATNTLEQNKEYTFTVAVRSSTGNVAMYTGTRGTPTYERVGQAASDKTILAIGLGTGGLFVLLVGCIVFFKVRLNREFQERRIKKQQYNPVAPNGDAPKPASGGAGVAETKAAR